MIRMLKRFDQIMHKEYDSIFLGRTLLRIIGCDDAFKKAEKYLQHETDSEGNQIGSYTEESLSKWYSHINEAIPQYINVENNYREIIHQYILHSKRFENHAVSYSVLYQQLYNGIK